MNYFLLIILKILSYLPISILRKFMSILYLVNKLFIRYRYKIIYNNIKIVFPFKSDVQVRKIREGFYDHFFNLFGEIIKLISINKLFIKERVSIKNPDLLDSLLTNYGSVVLMSGHFNNWEWMGAKISISYPDKFIAIYKKLNSSTFNNLFIKIRERFGGKTISMEESIRYIINNKKESKIIGIIGDQNPMINKSTEWITFFDKPIPVFMGGEQIAKKLNYPVIFCNMQKNDNKSYSITFEIIALDSSKTSKGEITKSYFDLLERQIKEEPTKWLWSHRRWRHTK